MKLNPPLPRVKRMIGGFSATKGNIGYVPCG